MKTDEAIRNRIRTALDRRLSSVVEPSNSQQRVLRLVRGEEKIVKKKRSAGFILAMALVLTAAVALAVATITETGRLMAQTEKENGDYLDWPAEKRVQIVTELMNEGYIPETAERTQLRGGTLSQEDAALIADAAIAEFTGDDASEASFLTIMMAAWGPFEKWTYEQQAWYSQVMEDAGFEVDGHTYYVEPTGSMTAEDAIEIAKQEIIRVFGMDRSVLDRYWVDCSYQIPEDAQQGDQKAYWYVCFTTWQSGLNEDEVPFNLIDMFVDPQSGKLRSSLEERAAAMQAAKERAQAPIRLTINAFYDSTNETGNFTQWRLENKARWSAEIAPLIKTYIAEHPDDDLEQTFNWYELASIDRIYGLPDDRAVPKEAALTAARVALQNTYRLSDDALSLMMDNGIPHHVKSFYDVTDPDRPLWKFFFSMPSIYDLDDALATRAKELFGTKYGAKADCDRFYKVEINAYTGEVVRTLNMRFMPNTLEGFKDCF